jgi:hypothetical protein
MLLCNERLLTLISVEKFSSSITLSALYWNDVLFFGISLYLHSNVLMKLFLFTMFHRVQLLRVLETRKTVLRKEQAMAFARAVAAGFDIDNLLYLISFAERFGASRLM